MINITMKTFKEYLAESKKVYSFKVKIAGELPENFQESLKKCLEKYKIITLEKMTTPIQESPLDFPELHNKEVTIYDLAVEYPITAPELVSHVKECGVMEDCMRIRGSSEPSEIDQIISAGGDAAEALLNDPFYKKESKIQHKDWFGDGFNKNFLKELAKTAKERNKELGNDKKDPNVLSSAPKVKEDNVGLKSAIGS